ncbi:MAG: fructosamine kinase family protein [Acidobacteriota bacterium]
MHQTVRAALEERLGARIERAEPVAGGSIHETRRLRLADGRCVFAKIVSAKHAEPGSELSLDIFAREAEGLEALGAGIAAVPGLDADLRVPRVIAVSTAPPFLVLEAIDAGSRPALGGDIVARFGHALARLHRGAVEPSGRFGFAHDNHLGATPQPNGWLGDWPTFWRRRRLGPLLDAARARGVSDRELDRLGDRLLERLDELLAIDEPPSLLHGDLWGGNYLLGAHGEAVLVDPAAYYGHREAELAMTRLFGGFDAGFEAAYAAEWPLADGAAERAPIYELHHLLNHLVLFGRGYRGGCLQRLRRVVG